MTLVCDWTVVSLQVSEGVCRAESVAAVCPGASGVLEHTGSFSPTGAGVCPRPSLRFPCKATDFVLFYIFHLYWTIEIQALCQIQYYKYLPFILPTSSAGRHVVVPFLWGNFKEILPNHFLLQLSLSDQFYLFFQCSHMVLRSTAFWIMPSYNLTPLGFTSTRFFFLVFCCVTASWRTTTNEEAMNGFKQKEKTLFNKVN